MTRSAVRGPGSNQYVDKAPLPPREVDTSTAGGVDAFLADPFGDRATDEPTFDTAAYDRVCDAISSNRWVHEHLPDDWWSQAVNDVESTLREHGLLRSGTLSDDDLRGVVTAMGRTETGRVLFTSEDAAYDIVAAIEAPLRREVARSQLPDQPFGTHTQFADWMTAHDPDSNACGQPRQWHGLDEGWSDGYEVAFEFDKPVADPAHLIAYYMRGPMGMGPDGFDGDTPGTPFGPVEEDGKSRVWRYGCDFTKSRRDDVLQAAEGLPDHIAAGSPIRKTDRSGPGTKGTQAVPGTGLAPRVAVR